MFLFYIKAWIYMCVAACVVFTPHTVDRDPVYTVYDRDTGEQQQLTGKLPFLDHRNATKDM